MKGVSNIYTAFSYQQLRLNKLRWIIDSLNSAEISYYNVLLGFRSIMIQIWSCMYVNFAYPPHRRSIAIRRCGLIAWLVARQIWNIDCNLSPIPGRQIPQNRRIIISYPFSTAFRYIANTLMRSYFEALTWICNNDRTVKHDNKEITRDLSILLVRK